MTQIEEWIREEGKALGKAEGKAESKQEVARNALIEGIAPIIIAKSPDYPCKQLKISK